jgi:hypothetical protein
MKVSEIAMNECVLELRAACRRPVEQAALEMVMDWVRPNFERILDRADGKKRWADLGPRVRENGRHLGALADFFANHTSSAAIGIEELTRAATMVRADCTVRAERIPVAWEFCPDIPVDVTAAEVFLRAIAPLEPARLAS